MADWKLIVTARHNNITKTEEFDHDELGTLDDILTGLFILNLDDIDKLTIERVNRG